MQAAMNETGTPTDELHDPQSRTISSIVIAVSMLTCTFIVALPMLGSLALAAAILAVFAGAGVATIFALSRL